MTKRQKLTFVPVLVLAVFSLDLFIQAQSKPNMSGTWKMNAAKSKFEQSAPKAITIKLDHQGSAMQEAFTLTNDQGELTVNFTYTLDGKESLQQLEGQTIKSTAKWEGESLVIEFKDDQAFNFRRKLTLSADGKTMTMDVKKSDPGGTANDFVVFEKQ